MPRADHCHKTIAAWLYQVDLNTVLRLALHFRGLRPTVPVETEEERRR